MKYILSILIMNTTLLLYAGEINPGYVSTKSDSQTAKAMVIESYDSLANQNNEAETIVESDRFEDIFNEAKIHFTNALIADHFGDSLEVQFQLRLCFESLSDIDAFNNMDEIQYEEVQMFTSRLLHDFKELSPDSTSLTEMFSVNDLRESMEYLAEDYIDVSSVGKFKIIEDREGHLPIVQNARVERIIEFFKKDGRDDFQAWLNRKPEMEQILIPILKEHEIPEEFIYLSMIESGFKTNAYSYAKAMGLWQFIYATGKRYGLKRDYWIDERMDFEKSTHAAAQYLKDLYDDFGDWYLVMASYNYGEGRIRRNIKWEGTRDYWKMRTMPRQTRNYVPTVLAAAIISKNPESYGFTVPAKADIFAYDTLTINKSVELESIARACKTNYKVLKKLNPELRKHSTPNYPYVIRIPKNSREKLLAVYKKFDDVPTVKYYTHRVRKGETLTRISRKYGVPVRTIMSANKLRNKQPILIGQRLTIPIPGADYSSNTMSSKPDLSDTHEKITHKVRKGETLGHIAEAYHTRASNIRLWNGLKYRDFIYPNQKLTIWVKKSSISGNIYTVRRGDSLDRISKKTGVSISKLKRLNPQIKRSLIYPGDKIKLNEKN